jgi:nucleoid-associated protein YgaU
MADATNVRAKQAAGAAAVVAALVALWFGTQSPPSASEAPAAVAALPKTGAPETSGPETAAPETAAAEPAAPVASGAETATETAPAVRFAPTLDIVRVEPDGSATVAGEAEAGAKISLRVDDIEAASASANGVGAYASQFTLPPSDKPRLLTVLSTAPDGVEVMGKDQIVLAPTAAPTIAALKLEEGAVAVIDAAQIANISVDTVTYDGDIIRIGGRGAGGAVVRLYLDNAEMATAPIMADGSFNAELSGVAAGTYLLRADQLDGAGAVTSRYEQEITKAAAAELATAASAPAVIAVTQGTTLWAIAAAQFGDGLMYVQVYEANKDKIRDPDLIYPGQVFTIPQLP